MRQIIKIGLLLFCGVLLNSCKRANFSSMDPNLPGSWTSSQTGVGYGAYCKFDKGDNFSFKDYGGDPSMEDDFEIGGNAKINLNDVIRIKNYQFKITEYPIPFDTIIRRDINNVHTHWRMKIAKGYAFIHGKWSNGYAFYKE